MVIKEEWSLMRVHKVVFSFCEGFIMSEMRDGL